MTEPSSPETDPITRPGSSDTVMGSRITNPTASDPVTPPNSPTRMNQRGLREAIAAKIRLIPGVHGLEPTLSTAGLRAMYRRSHTDGIQLIARNGLIDVDINLATNATRQVRQIAETVQTTITELIRTTGYTPGSTTVSVLRIEPPAIDD